MNFICLISLWWLFRLLSCVISYCKMKRTKFAMEIRFRNYWHSNQQMDSTWWFDTCANPSQMTHIRFYFRCTVIHQREICCFRLGIPFLTRRVHGYINKEMWLVSKLLEQKNLVSWYLDIRFGIFSCFFCMCPCFIIRCSMFSLEVKVLLIAVYRSLGFALNLDQLNVQTLNKVQLIETFGSE